MRQLTFSLMEEGWKRDWNARGENRKRRQGEDGAEDSNKGFKKFNSNRSRRTAIHKFAGKGVREPIRTQIVPEKQDLNFYWLQGDYEYDSERGGTVVQMYGRQEGTMASVQARISGFYPHFYIKKPKGWEEERIENLVRVLDIRLRGYLAEFFSFNFEFTCALKDHHRLIAKWNIIRGEELVAYWGPEPEEFIDIYVVHPKMVKHLKDLIFNPMGKMKTVEKNKKKELAVEIPAWCSPDMVKMVQALDVYEADVDFIVRFIVDKKFNPSSWYSIKAGSYTLAKSQSRNSRCEIEVHADLSNVIPLKDDLHMRTTPDLVEIDLDIEVATDGPFPTPSKALFPITKISICLSTYLDSCCRKDEDGHECPESGACKVKNYVFSLLKCKTPPNADEVFCYDTEAELLEALWDFILHVDPDVIAHHNGNGFDLLYICKRGEVLRLDLKWDCFGRSIKQKVYCKSHTSKGYKKWSARVPGRFNLDILRMAQDDTKLPSHSLQALAEAYLKESKEEIHHTLMAKYQETELGREKLAKYNMKDSILTRKIRKKKKYVQTVLGMGPSYVLAQVTADRAQGAKIEPLLRISCAKEEHDKDGKQTRIRKLKISKRKGEKTQNVSYAKHEGLSKAAYAKKTTNKKNKRKRDGDNNNEGEDEMEIDEQEQERKEMLDESEAMLLDGGAEEDEESMDRNAAELFESQKQLREDGLLGEDDDEDDSYAGALVLKPICGYYPNDIVITLDFAGMYPSIIRRWNLCFSTLVTREVIDKLGLKPSYFDDKGQLVEEDYWQLSDFRIDDIKDELGNVIDQKLVDVPNPALPCFLTKKYKRGVLPEIEDELANGRSRVKSEMEVVKREMERINIVTGISDMNRKISELKKGTPTKEVQAEIKACEAKISRIKKEPIGERCIPAPDFIYPNPKNDPDYPSTIIRAIWLMKKIREGEKEHQKELDKIYHATVDKHLKDLDLDYSNKDIDQNAKKVSQNAVYGLTGDKTSPFYQKEIATTVTSLGRRMIATIKLEVERNYCKRNGWWFDSVVIYGDTDSVFVRLIDFCIDPKDYQSRGEAASVGTMMAMDITKRCFVAPIKLAYEKLYTNLNMIGPKNYYGCKWEINSLEPKLDVKGLQMIKRGPPAFIKDTCKKVVETLVMDDDYEKSLSYASQRRDMLLDREVAVCDLIQRQKLSKALDEYGKVIEVKVKKTGKTHLRKQAVSAFVNLAKRLKEKHPDREIDEGTIIALVHVDLDAKYGEKKSEKTGDKTEEPLTVLTEGMPIDIDYYLDSLNTNLIKILGNPVTHREPIKEMYAELTKDGMKVAKFAKEEDLAQEKTRLEKKLAPMRSKKRAIGNQPEMYHNNAMAEIEDLMRDDLRDLKEINKRIKEMNKEKGRRVCNQLDSRQKKSKKITPMQEKSGLFGFLAKKPSCGGCGTIIDADNQLPAYWCGICDRTMNNCDCVATWAGVPVYMSDPCRQCGGELGHCSHRKSGNSAQICQACALIIDQIADESVLSLSKVEAEEKEIWANCAKCMSTDIREDLESCIAVECKFLGRRKMISGEISKQKKRTVNLFEIAERDFPCR